MELETFRKRIREACRPTGYSQKMLAYELGMQPAALSNKLNGTGETSLKHIEVRQIIKVMAQWEAITSQTEAIELLEMMNLKQNSFTPEEWNSIPLSKLAQEVKPAFTNPPKPVEPPIVLSVTQSNDQSIEPLHNLPANPTSLIGRKREVAEVLSLIKRPEVRLLTLTGSGGVGKTRLVLEIANGLLNTFQDGVYFVSLAPLRDPGLVLSTIARTLHIRESGTLSVPDLVRNYLRDKDLLLVLDNFEQVLPASGLLKELLAELPHLKLMITSRSLLRVYGEYEYVVPPLTLPDPALLQTGDRLPPIVQLVSYEAIALFVQRAQATNGTFKLTPENARAVVEICQRLDGLPLALELAAARIKIMTPQLILARLSHRLELLNRGPHDLPERQQTLRALVDWSYDLLRPDEQNLLVRLSVFAGGCDLEAVEAVCRDEEGHLSEWEVGTAEQLNRLADLADKSMLQLAPNESGELRFSMLEILGEYALEKLKAEGKEGLFAERHALYYLKLAEQAEQNLANNQQKAWIDRLETEHDNFRAALAWAITEISQETSKEKRPLLGQEYSQSGKVKESNPALIASELALRLSSYLAWFWDAHGHLSEGRRWLEQALEASGNLAAKGDNKSYRQFRAKALNAAGNLARKQGDNNRATTLLVEALVLRQALGLPLEISQTLNNLGVLAYHQGDQLQAQKFYEESLAIKYKLGDKRSIGLSLNNLAELVRERGEEGRAIALFEESLNLLREVGDIQNCAAVLLNLGVAISDQGDARRAGSVLIESLRLFGELGDKFHIAETLERLAGLATNPGQAELSARLFGAADGLRQAISAPVGGNYRSRYEQSVRAVEAQFDPALWSHYWAAGQAMTMDEAIHYALVEFPAQLDKLASKAELPSLIGASNTIPEAKTTSQNQPNSLPGGLTLREVEVIKLVATGMTTAQIAEKLILSPLTVQAHLRSIYSKLEITSRSAATRYALENKLV